MPDAVNRIIGIDPGTRNVGYGVLEKRGGTLVRLVSGSIHADGSMAERLLSIHRELQKIIDMTTPAAAAIETVFTGDNPKTSIAIGEGRGVAVLSAIERGLTVTGYEPALVKRAVAGNGRASKEQVRQMVTILLKLETPPETDHESDALALAFTHALHCRFSALRGEEKAALPAAGAARKVLPEAVLKQLPAEVLPLIGKRGCRRGKGGFNAFRT